MCEPKEQRLPNNWLVIPVTVDGQVYWVPSRALSLTQPWPYLMLNLPPEYRKDVENRVPGFMQLKFRGPVWVHASGTTTKTDWGGARQEADRRGVPEELLPVYGVAKWRVLCPLSGIVGQFTITGYYPPSPQQVLDCTCRPNWHFPNHHGFPAKNPTRVPFTECKGALGFWRVPYPTLCSVVRSMLRAGQVVPDARNTG